MHTRIAALALGLGAVATTVAGCGNGVTGSSGGGSADPSPTATTTVTATPQTTTPAPTPSPVPSTTPTSGPTPAPASSASPVTTPSPVPVGRCAAGDLTVSVDDSDGGGAMGSVYVLLVFANHSKSFCALSGHPGVSFVGKSAGTQIGAPAVREGKVTSVVLRPGERTTAVLRVGQAGNYDAKSCAPTTSDGFRVYPPGSTTSVFVAYKAQACQKDVTKLSPQLSISAVGTRQ